jgi:AmmeMemoRadiSam system protein B
LAALAAEALAAGVDAACGGRAERSGWAGTAVVIGGHLPAGADPLFAMEDAADTPLGPMEIDGGLRDALCRELEGREDRRGDNTVEVLIPMVKYFFPAAQLLWMRLPAEACSFEAGQILARIAASLERPLVVLGSTDLTHYGVNYGFTPRGNGPAALDWVKNVNDRRFIEAVEQGDPGQALERAEGEKSACSAGAVLAVMGYASQVRESAGAAGKCIAHGTSADTAPAEGGNPPDSFVGYGAFSWE